MNKHFIFGLGLGYLFARGGARRNYGGATRDTGDVPWPIVKQGIIAEINKGGNGKEYLKGLKGQTIKLPAGEYTFYKIQGGDGRKGEKINTWKMGTINAVIEVQKGKESNNNTRPGISDILVKIANEESAIPWKEVKQGIIAEIDRGGDGREYLGSTVGDGGVKGRAIKLPTSGEYSFYREISVYKGKELIDRFPSEEKIDTWKVRGPNNHIYVLKGEESENNRKTKTKLRVILPKIANEESVIPWAKVKKGIIAEIKNGGDGERYLQSTVENGGVNGRVIKLPTSGRYKFYPLISSGRDKLPSKEEIETWKMGGIGRVLYVLKGKKSEKNRKTRIEIGITLIRAAKDLPLTIVRDEKKLLGKAVIALKKKGFSSRKVENIENTPTEKTLRNWARDYASDWEPSDSNVTDLYNELANELKNYPWSEGVREALSNAYHEILGGARPPKEEELLGMAFVALNRRRVTQDEIANIKNTPSKTTLQKWVKEHVPSNWEPTVPDVIALYNWPELKNYAWSKGVRDELLKAYPEIEGGQPAEAFHDKIYWEDDLPDEKELLVRAFVALNSDKLKGRKLSQNKFSSIENTPSRATFQKWVKKHVPSNWEPSESNITDLYNELANHGWSKGVRKALRNAYPWLPQENPRPRRWGSPQQNPRPRRWGSRW